MWSRSRKRTPLIPRLVRHPHSQKRKRKKENSEFFSKIIARSTAFKGNTNDQHGGTSSFAEQKMTGKNNDRFVLWLIKHTLFDDSIGPCCVFVVLFSSIRIYCRCSAGERWRTAGAEKWHPLRRRIRLRRFLRCHCDLCGWTRLRTAGCAPPCPGRLTCRD